MPQQTDPRFRRTVVAPRPGRGSRPRSVSSRDPGRPSPEHASRARYFLAGAAIAWPTAGVFLNIQTQGAPMLWLSVLLLAAVVGFVCYKAGQAAARRRQRLEAPTRPQTEQEKRAHRAGYHLDRARRRQLYAAAEELRAQKDT